MSKNKRGKKSKLKGEVKISDDSSFTDFLCPICLEILVEPVQLPCKHELCIQCFQTHVKDTSLNCPMCRVRIAVWVRKNSKTNTLVNHERWALIQSLFPERIKRRLEGLDDIEDDHFSPHHKIAEDGEVRKEYEEELKKIEKEHEKISQANLEFIKKLQEEEARQRKEQEEIDLLAAKELQRQEMANLGVTLKSPTQHQKELLAMLKPKSPMKLRCRTLPKISTLSSTSSSRKSKVMRKVLLTSPNHTITSFFKKSDESVNTSSDDIQNCSTATDSSFNGIDDQNNTRNREHSTTSTTGSSTITRRFLDNSRSSTDDILESDQELAERLQMEYYDKEWQKNNPINNNRTPGRKKPLQIRSKNFIIDVDSPPSSIKLPQKNNLAVMMEDVSCKKRKKKNS